MSTAPPIKVALVTASFPARSESFIRDQVQGLLQRGVSVDVYARRASSPAAFDFDQPRFRFREIEPMPASRLVHLRRLATSLSVQRLRSYPKLARCMDVHSGPRANADTLWHALAMLNETYDIVHCHFGPSGLTGAHLRRAGLTDAKLVVTFHGYDVSSVFRRRRPLDYRPVFRYADTVGAVSDHWREKLIGLGCPAEKTAVLRMGVDVGAIPFSARQHTSAPLRIISTGRLVEKKGFALGIRAVAKARREIPLRYEIIGDGPLRPELEQLIHDLGLTQDVRILGWRERHEVLRYLTQANVFMAPSVTASDGDQEGIPVAIMEAMATGAPVVSTRHTGIPELVAHDGSGILVPEGDVAALKDAILRLCNNNELRAAFGREGRRIIETKFNQETIMDNLVRHYRRLLDCRTPFVGE